MNRWTARILGLLLLLVFLLLFANLQKQLVQLQKARAAQAPPTTTTH
jgi:hypothetical protein